MFHLYQPDHIEWPVSVDLPKGAIKRTFTFKAYFYTLDEEDAQELQNQHNQMLAAMRKRIEALQGYNKDEGALTEPLPCTYRDLADQVLCGWDDQVRDNDNQPIEFNESSKALMYQVQGAAAAIFKSWLESLGQPSEKSAAKAGGFRAKN